MKEKNLLEEDNCLKNIIFSYIIMKDYIICPICNKLYLKFFYDKHYTSHTKYQAFSLY